MASYRIPGPQGLNDFPHNQVAYSQDENISSNEILIKGLAAGWVGWEISLLGKTALRLSGENFFVTGRADSNIMWVPKSGSTSPLIIYKASNPRKHFRLDYHVMEDTGGRPVWHYNRTSGFAEIKGLRTEQYHAVTSGANRTGQVLTIFRWGGRAMFVAGGAMSVYEVYHAEKKSREITRQVGGWAGASVAGRYCASAGARFARQQRLLLGN